MSRICLTSINKPHIDNILSGIKTVEWRTKPLPEGEHLLYETKNYNGSGMVQGRMIISRSYVFNDPDEIPNFILRKGMVSREYLKKYARGRKLYANIISEAQHLRPINITNLVAFNTGKIVSQPPQSYMYIESWGINNFAQIED